MDRSELYRNAGQVLSIENYDSSERFLADLHKGCQTPGEEILKTMVGKMIGYGTVAAMASWEMGPIGVGAAELVAGVFAVVDTAAESVHSETTCKNRSLKKGLEKSFQTKK